MESWGRGGAPIFALRVLLTAALLALPSSVHAAFNDNYVENINGQPEHTPTATAFSSYTYRDSADVFDTMAPRLMFSCWENDLTAAYFNYNTGGNWREYTMSRIGASVSGGKDVWSTSPLVSEIQSLAPGSQVRYDFKLVDGTAERWLKLDNDGNRYFTDNPNTGSSFSFTIEGISVTPTSLAADSSTATLSCWVTKNGTPVSGQTVTFTFVSGPGAYFQNNVSKRTDTAVTDGNGRANIQVQSGTAGTAILQAAAADLTTCTTSIVFVSFLIDGNDADFPARYIANTMSDNDSKIADGTWVWRDATGDARPGAEIDNPGGYNADNWDIREVRMTGSSDSFRVLVSLKDGDGPKNPMVLLAIDTDVTRDTSSSVTTPGPGPATSVRDFGNWWLPAGAATGTRHIGAASANVRGERQQLDQSRATFSDGLYPSRWDVYGDNAIDGGTDSTVGSNADPTVTGNRRTESGGGNPNELKWDYSPITNQIYLAFQNYHNDSDHVLFLADETTTSTLPWYAGYWNKAGNVMHFDLFVVRSDGGWYQGTQVAGRNWMGGTAWNSGVPVAQVTTDTDGDNVGMTYWRSNGDNPTLEGVVDLDDLLRESGVLNGDLFVVTSAYGPNDGQGAGHGVPTDAGNAGGSLIGDTRFQRIWIELPSDASTEQVAEWERAITFNNQNPGGGASATAIWYAPGGRNIGYHRREFATAQSYLDAVNYDTFEFGCRWQDLMAGRRPPFTLRFTIGVGQSSSGGSDATDNYRYFTGRRANATSAYGGVSSLLDLVSNQTTSNELNDSDVDYFVDVDFNRDGRVNTPPDTATNLGITESGETSLRSAGTILNDATPVFQWSWNDTDGVGSIRYPAWHLQVLTDAAHTTVHQEKYSDNDSATSWEYSGAALTSGNKYYWRVRTRDDFGWGPWTYTNAMYSGGRTDSFSFRINSTPNPPSYLRVDGETNPTTLLSSNPTFSWNFTDPDPNDGQLGFAIEVYNGSTLVHAETNATSNAYWVYPDTATPLQGGTNYNWRVRYWDLNTAHSTWAPTTVPSDSTFGTNYTSPGVQDLKIAQIGNNHGTYGDYVMIWNPLDTVVKLAGMSLQRWSATVATSWAGVLFGYRDTIPAGGYYLVSQNSGALTDTMRLLDVITTSQGFALVRNYSAVASTTDSDIIDGIGFGQSVDTTNLATSVIDGGGEVVIRRATSTSNTFYGLTRDSDVRFAGHYVDGNEAADWAEGTTQDPRGRASTPSRLDFRIRPLTVDSRTVEAGVPFVVEVTAIDYRGQRISDTTTSSYADRSKFRVSSGFSVTPSLSIATCSGGILVETLTITASTGNCTLYADTTIGVDTTGIGVVGGETLVVVVAAAPPTKPVITTPAAGAYVLHDACTIAWTRSYDTTFPIRYRVQVAKSDTFGFGIVADTWTYDTTLGIGALNPADSFYVRVAAYDPGNYADTSTTAAFRAVRGLSYFELHETDPALLYPSRTVRRGSAFNLRIIARDTSGAVVTTYRGTVTLSVARGTISPTTLVLGLADAGDTTCSVTISDGWAGHEDTITVDSGGFFTARTVVVPLNDNRLVINEVYPTDTNTGSNDDRDEWVEILNRSTGDVSTSGWLLTDYENDVTLPAVTIPSGRSLVVHWRETGVLDDVFTDSDRAAHWFAFPSTANRLGYHQEELGLYSSLTKDSLTIASYVAWANASTWGAQNDQNAVDAGIWDTDVTVNHGAASAELLAGRSIYRILEGGDTTTGTGDWATLLVRDTFVFTEGFPNTSNDTTLTGVTVSIRSGSGSSDSVAIGETIIVRLAASGGGDPATQGVVTVRVASRTDPNGIIVTLLESLSNSNLFEQTVLVTSFADSGSRDGSRWIGVGASDSITATWVKGGSDAVTSVPGFLKSFQVTGPTTASNGEAFQIVIAAKTFAGVTKFDYAGTVNLTVSSGSINPTTNTFVLSDSGVDTVTVTVTGASAGTCTITVTEASTGETGVYTFSVIVLGPIINEVLQTPANIDWDGSGAVDANQDEWIELFNRSNSAVGVTNWKIGEVTRTRVTLSDTIEARGYLVVYRRGSGSAMGAYYDSSGAILRTRTFGTGAMGPLTSGGVAALTNSTGETMDQVTVPALNVDSTYARSWDGGTTWRTNARASVDSPTPVAYRDSVANMRFRVELPESGTLGVPVNLKIGAYNPSHVLSYGDTTTDFSGTATLSTGSGATPSITTATFANGVCSTYITFSSVSGTTTLTVRFETNTVGRDAIWLVAGVTDETPPARPSNLAAVAVITATPAVDTGVLLTWSANTETDVAEYRLYRGPNPETNAAGFTLICTRTIGVTTYLDSSVGWRETAYYVLVAVDSAGNRSDSAGSVTSPSFVVVKTIDSASLGSLPGSSLLYRLSVENVGWGPADSVVVFDTITAAKVFRDTVTTEGEWEFQYSTAAAPAQSYYSADYVSGVPADPTLVRFVRWRRLRVTTGEPAAIFRFRAIIP